MADIPTCMWIGASGAKYSYYVLELPVLFNPNQLGNYIYAKVNADNIWVPLYIGQGELSDRVRPERRLELGIAEKGATHVHVHANPLEEHRLAEEKDLLANYSVAYKPSGCNER